MAGEDVIYPMTMFRAKTSAWPDRSAPEDENSRREQRAVDFPARLFVSIYDAGVVLRRGIFHCFQMCVLLRLLIG